MTAAAEPGTDPTDEAAAATGNELLRTRHAQMFPRLTPEQIARLEHQGERVPMHAGELLFDSATDRVSSSSSSQAALNC